MTKGYPSDQIKGGLCLVASGVGGSRCRAGDTIKMTRLVIDEKNEAKGGNERKDEEANGKGNDREKGSMGSKINIKREETSDY